MSLFQLETISFLSLFKVFLFFFFSNAVRYFTVAGVFYLIFWKFGSKRFQSRKIIHSLKHYPNPRREILQSIPTMVMFGFVGVAVILLKHFGISRMYHDVSERGWGYFFLSVLLMLFIHDTYFYFLHRFMHHPRLYSRVHSVHHRSTHPTPFAAFSFHPYEAFFEAGIVFLSTMLIPVHIGAFFTFTVISLFMNVNGHLGYELYSERFRKHPVFGWLNTSTAHNHHHQWVEGNYGLYFTFWDRLLGTWKA